jgi:hypothetical protein
MRLKHSIAAAAGIAAAVSLGVAAIAWAEPQAGQPVTKSLQGEPSVSMETAIKMLYDMMIEAGVKAGPDKVDVAALDVKVREMSHSLSAGHDLTPKQMEDHVVDMTHQMLAIGKKDPKIWDSVASFSAAMRGPD